MNPDHPSIKDIEANPNNYPGGGKNNTKLAQSWQPAAGLNEDNYTVDVKRMRLHGTTNNSDGSAYANVYGDSTSVYLTANLDELFNDSKELNVGRSYGIIKDVDAVTTGVADVSIKVMTKEAAQKAADNAGKLDSQKVKDTAYGIYTLYDSDGIVIASVVVGEVRRHLDLDPPRRLQRPGDHSDREGQRVQRDEAHEAVPLVRDQAER